MEQVGRTFRIFVSSTFEDMEEERNALQRNVFPRLKALCAERGRRFQAIDLRWGVSEEAGRDQKTMSICLEELRRCQRVTPRPNFIVLLGDRYGWRPLPEAIGEAEFNDLLEKVADDHDKELLLQHYELDLNAIPHIQEGDEHHVYFLKPRVLDIPDGSTPEEEEEAKELESGEWKKIESRLSAVLRDASCELDLDPDQRLKYLASATEQEIEEGAFKVEDAREHVFCFFRKIDPLSESKTNEVDPEAQERLQELKDRLRDRLPKEHLFAYSKTTSNQIDAFCDAAHEALVGIIAEEMEASGEINSYERELEEQNAFCTERASFFTGRKATLKAIADFIEGPGGVMTLYGEGGIGKSAVIARAVQLAHEDPMKARIIYRFIGATPNSTDIRALLEGICRQVARAYNVEEDIKQTYEDLVQDFPKKLELATEEEPLIIFLDSLDQLSEAYNAHNLAWLPLKANLPAHVYIVLSTRPDAGLEALRSKYLEKVVVEIGPMPLEEGEETIRLWLENAGRTLKESQREEVISKFLASTRKAKSKSKSSKREQGGNPLYLRMAFNEAKLWTSSREGVVLAPDVGGIIRDLYGRLSDEANHGAAFTSRALGYLAASRCGLSEDEIIEILSRDKEIIKSFEQRRSPGTPSFSELGVLPVAVWSRFYFDLAPYLTEASAENTSLLAFYHRELKEVAAGDYLKTKRDSRKINVLLAEYFNQVGDPRQEEEGDAVGFRDTTRDWDRWYGTTRALSELPYHATMAGMWDELFLILTDFRFLENKAERANKTELKDAEGKTITSYGGVFDLQKDYDFALKSFPED